MARQGVIHLEAVLFPLMGIEIGLGMEIIYFHSEIEIGMRSRNYFENGNRIEIVIVI